MNEICFYCGCPVEGDHAQIKILSCCEELETKEGPLCANCTEQLTGHYPSGQPWRK